MASSDFGRIPCKTCRANIQNYTCISWGATCEKSRILPKTKAFTRIYGHKVHNHNAQTTREFASFTAKQRGRLSAKLRTCTSFQDVIPRNTEICHALHSRTPRSRGLSPTALFHEVFYVGLPWGLHSRRHSK